MSIKCRFTLIELLIVIVIIAILAGMLLPLLSRAKERARRVLCLSNQKNLVVGVLMYAEENSKNDLPLDGRNTVNRYLHMEKFRYDMFNALNLTHEVYECPTAPRFGLYKSPSPHPWTYSTSFLYTVVNHKTNSRSYIRNRERITTGLKDANPEERTVFSERVMFSYRGGGAGYYMVNHQIADRQPAGGNQVFLDGHGAWKRDYPRFLDCSTNADGAHLSAPGGSTWWHWWW